MSNGDTTYPTAVQVQTWRCRSLSTSSTWSLYGSWKKTRINEFSHKYLTLNVSTYSWWTYEVFIGHWSLILNNPRFIWMEIAHFGRFSIRICKTYYFSVRAYVRVCAIVSVVSRMRKTRNGKIGRYNLRLRMIFYMIMQVDLSTSKGSLFAFKLLWNYVWLCNHSNSIFAAIR